jgi:hypothetical protein
LPEDVRRKTTNGGTKLRAFLTAQHGLDVSLVLTAIRDANWSVTDTFSGGPNGQYLVREEISNVDAVIVAGGASTSRDFGALMIEVGIALGVAKPVLVLWEESSPPPPNLPPELRVVRINLRNADALKFHIKVFLANAREGLKIARPKSAVRASPHDVIQLRRRLEDLQAHPQAGDHDFLNWLEDLFGLLGAKSVQTSHSSDRGFDLVVSAPSDLALDGPVLLEAKTRWPRGSQLQHLTHRLESIVASERASLGMLVSLAGSEFRSDNWPEWTSPSILVYSAADLLHLVALNGTLAEILLAPGREAGSVL